MPITFPLYHVYNKVFYHEFNKLVFIHPFYSIPVELLAFPSLGRLQDRTVV